MTDYLENDTDDEVSDLSEPTLRSRLLRRFYEPLSLLCALGKARDSHTNKTLPGLEFTDSLTQREIRRRFLNDLAYLCDYEKGGDTVTAIGLETTPQKVKFWVATNQVTGSETAQFLRVILRAMKEYRVQDRQTLTERIFYLGVERSRPRIMTYARFLLMELDKLEGFERCQDPKSVQSIALWKTKLKRMESDPHSLVEFAYQNRHSEFLRQLCRYANDQSYNTSWDSLQTVSISTRHYIGRLGLHARAARAIALYTPRILPELENYKVCMIQNLRHSIGCPPARRQTTLQDALRRMISSGTRNYNMYEESLAHMDGPLQLTRRFRENFDTSDSQRCVHAEIQVLNHFESLRLDFVDGDKYIACSKPACFCCRLFFRHHPGGYVEPDSHNKIYMSWQPPGIPRSGGLDNNNQLEIILDLMIKDIRQDALRQISKRAGPRRVHPDTVTGISASGLAAQFDSLFIRAERETLADDFSNNARDLPDNDTSSSPDAIAPDAEREINEGGISLLLV